VADVGGGFEGGKGVAGCTPTGDAAGACASAVFRVRSMAYTMQTHLRSAIFCCLIQCDSEK